MVTVQARKVGGPSPKRPSIREVLAPWITSNTIMVFLARATILRHSTVPGIIDICQTLSRLMEMIHVMLYEEESKGLDDPRGYIQDGPRAVT